MTESADVVFIRGSWPRDIFRVRVDAQTSDVLFQASVDEVTSWGEDDAPAGFEPYLDCLIKWDGCSHVWFGEPTSEGDRTGYLHLCGADDFRKHVALMTELYALAFRRMGREPADD